MDRCRQKQGNSHGCFINLRKPVKAFTGGEIKRKKID